MMQCKFATIDLDSQVVSSLNFNAFDIVTQVQSQMRELLSQSYETVFSADKESQ